MFKTINDDLAAHIIEHNPFFSSGFGNAWQDEETGYVYADVNSGRKAIFPDDRLGNYFYLRPTGNVIFQEDQDRFPRYDCKMSGTMAKVDVRLVAVVTTSADADLLMQRLINTLGFSDALIQLGNGNLNREQVVVTEMRYAEADEKLQALQNLKKEVIVSIDFTMITEVDFSILACLNNICRPC